MIKKQTHENDENVLNDLEKEIREMEELLEDLPFHEPINKTEKHDPISQGDKIRILREKTLTLFNTLTAREERLIRMYFGYGLNHSFKVYEMARQFDLSEADIRQQLTTAFRRFLKGYFLLIQNNNKTL
jgi:DNA-directed RNA polymerase sigma subunit (sigma70/sigma32)